MSRRIFNLIMNKICTRAMQILRNWLLTRFCLANHLPLITCFTSYEKWLQREKCLIKALLPYMIGPTHKKNPIKSGAFGQNVDKLHNYNIPILGQIWGPPQGSPWNEDCSFHTHMPVLPKPANAFGEVAGQQRETHNIHLILKVALKCEWG
jgi:hypothetical protein